MQNSRSISKGIREANTGLLQKLVLYVYIHMSPSPHAYKAR